MVRKRYTNQILYKILEVCNGDGASKTAVVYASEMNFKTIVPYLDLLIENGLLEVISKNAKYYRITSKGDRALNCLRILEELIS